MFDISWTTTARAPNCCVIDWLELSNIFLKSGVPTTHGLEVLKVRKETKFVLNSRVDISRTTKARASRFCVGVWLKLSNITSIYCLVYFNLLLGISGPPSNKVPLFDKYALGVSPQPTGSLLPV